ncbi:hypothetical protein [Waddlia chondrophila]|uniref:Uncharacterized protein n=2 Tax=Waddlia chondrophila TaxID=71667 RepID=D6YT08_WADCW|nr:hypothetical protein [Waddlia chondrophila]ADI39203.1 hypothetical protein wcw_1865 [Waddlia chondrophila WSU 86-1044]
MINTSYFSFWKGITGNSKKPADSERELSEQDNKASKYSMKIHIWQTDAEEGRCGHTSVSLHEEKDGHSEEEYGGMWPDKKNIILLSHPFAYLLASVKGEIHPKRSHCEEREGDDEAMRPDSVYTIDVTESKYRELKEKMSKDKGDVDKGMVLYSLFQKVNLLSVVKLCANESFMRNVMDGDFLEEYPEVLENAASIRNLRSEHCTSFAKSYVETAGFKVRESFSPWGISPLGLNSQLAKLSEEHAEIQAEHYSRTPKFRDRYSDDL